MTVVSHGKSVKKLGAGLCIATLPVPAVVANKQLGIKKREVKVGINLSGHSTHLRSPFSTGGIVLYTNDKVFKG